jgi:hypothetical protein
VLPTPALSASSADGPRGGAPRDVHHIWHKRFGSGYERGDSAPQTPEAGAIHPTVRKTFLPKFAKGEANRPLRVYLSL